LLSFGASAWKLADRERFIGWTHEQRRRNLQFIVNKIAGREGTDRRPVVIDSGGYRQRRGVQFEARPPSAPARDPLGETRCAPP
jgi:ABC-type taurine transport system ATPase subunit